VPSNAVVSPGLPAGAFGRTGAGGVPMVPGGVGRACARMIGSDFSKGVATDWADAPDMTGVADRAITTAQKLGSVRILLHSVSLGFSAQAMVFRRPPIELIGGRPILNSDSLFCGPRG
jgi:hypothetical protein